MLCDIFQKNMDAWLEGELEGSLSEQMDVHFNECETCRELARQVSAMREELLELNDEPLPEDMHERMMAAVEQDKKSGKGRIGGKKLGWKGIGAAAAAAVVLLVALPIAGNLLSGLRYRNDFAAPQGGAGANYSSMSMKSASDRATPEAMPSMAAAPMEGAPLADMGTDDAQGLYGLSGESLALSEEKTMEPGTDSGNNAYGEKIIRSANLSVETRQFDQDVEQIRTLVKNYGGYEESFNSSGIPYDRGPDSYGRWASLNVRVPSEALDAFLAASKGVGNVIDTAIWSQDVTARYQDTELQLQTLRAQHERIVELIAKAEQIEDLISLEQELQRIQYNMDSLTGTLRTWDAKVEYSSISINITEVKSYSAVQPVDPTLGERISESFYQSINGLIELSQDALVGLIAAVPYIVLLLAAGVVALVVVLIVRRSRRARAGKDE